MGVPLKYFCVYLLASFRTLNTVLREDRKVLLSLQIYSTTARELNKIRAEDV